MASECRRFGEYNMNLTWTDVGNLRESFATHERIEQPITKCRPSLNGYSLVNFLSTLLIPALASAQIYTLTGANSSDRFGVRVETIGDLDGDGYDDIAISEINASPGVPGKVRVVSGDDGTTIYTINGNANDDCFGSSMARLPDINSDGKNDFIVGAPYCFSNPTHSGYARVVSGANGSTITTLTPANTTTHVRFGYSVADGGDINADGYRDYLVGAPYTIDSQCTSQGTPYSGMVYAISGASGNAVLYSKIGGRRGLGCCTTPLTCVSQSPWECTCQL